jgi:hypothetical protein
MLLLLFFVECDFRNTCFPDIGSLEDYIQALQVDWRVSERAVGEVVVAKLRLVRLVVVFLLLLNFAISKVLSASWCAWQPF